MNSVRLILSTASFLALCAASAPALAQETDAPPAADGADSDTSGLGDIVVTARRRSEGLQDVPVAITALSGEDLETKNVVSVEQLRNFAPGLNVSQVNRSDANFYIRGQGPGIVGGGQRNFTSVATYFAEVPTPVAGAGALYDLASVQVLKGPQGTLFGRNTTGGAVLFEPQKPKFEFGGYFKVSAGNYHYREAEGVINLPIVEDVLAVRVAGNLGRRHGYTRSVITDQKLDSRNNDSYRVSVLFKPTPDIENLTIVDSNYRDNTGNGAVMRQVYPQALVGSLPNPLSPELSETLGLPASFPLMVASPSSSFIGCLSYELPGCATGPYGSAVAAFQAAAANGGFGLTGITPDQFYAALAQQQALGVRKVLEPNLLYLRSRSFGVTNKTSFQVSDNILLKNIFSFRKERVAESNNLSGVFSYLRSDYETKEPPYIRGFEQYTEEFQIQGSVPSAGLEYILGFYHEEARPGFKQSYRSYGFGEISNTKQDYTDKSDAIFAHAELDVTDALQISGGLRHTWDKRKASSSVVTDDGTCAQTDPMSGDLLCPATGSAKFKALTGDVTLQYKFNNSVLVYASYRRGYKSGGFNLPAATADTLRFKPETVDDIEVGLKADWDIGFPIRTNLSLFRDKYSGIQVALPVFVNNATYSLVQNAASAVNKGFEFETTMAPAEGLHLGAFVSFLDAKCKVNAGTACRIGRQIAYQPRWKWSVNASYALPLDSADVLVTADYSWTGKVNTPDPDAVLYGLSDSLPSYGVANARLEWRDALIEGLDLAVFANNVFNKTYAVGGYSIASFLGVEPVLYGEPRMYGASLKFRFGS